jgi:signal transduction histidine kinase
MDVTAQEQLTEEMERRVAYLAEAQRLSRTGSFGWKPDTGEIIWSAETYRILEYDRALRPTIDLAAQRVHPEDRAIFQSVIDRAFEGASDFQHTYRLLLPDGRVRHVHACAHALLDASGNREFVGAFTDITERKTAEDALWNERTRIARELHDTLLQSFHASLLGFTAASALLPERPFEARQILDRTLDQAAKAINEGREAIQGLRSSQVGTNDLALAVKTLGEELAAEESNQNSTILLVEVEGRPRNLHSNLRDEIYRIIAEAMRNAFKHAQARRIEVRIRHDERELRVRVRDDGTGIEPKFLTEGGRPGHFGLLGMRERAKQLGGNLAVCSEFDSGTDVELSIPASIAYKPAVSG